MIVTEKFWSVRKNYVLKHLWIKDFDLEIKVTKRSRFEHFGVRSTRVSHFYPLLGQLVSKNLLATKTFFLLYKGVHGKNITDSRNYLLT